MSRSGPLHHNRVAKNVALSCAHSWGYTYGKRRIVTSPACPSDPRFAGTTAMHRARGSRGVRDRRKHVTKRIVPSIRCRLPMRMRSVSALRARVRRRLFHPWNLLLPQRDRRLMSGTRDETGDLCVMLRFAAARTMAPPINDHDSFRAESAPFRYTSARYGANDRVTGGRMHGHLFGTVGRHFWEMTFAGRDDICRTR